MGRQTFWGKGKRIVAALVAVGLLIWIATGLPGGANPMGDEDPGFDLASTIANEIMV